jgi:hypothetical protein
MRQAPGLRSLLVRRWLLRSGVSAGALTARHAQAVRELAERRGGRAEVHLPGGWTARRVGTVLVAAPPLPRDRKDGSDMRGRR